MMVGAAAAIAIVAGAWMWSQQPDYRVLFGNLSDRDGGATIAALSQMNVPYKFADGGGALLVPADRVHETRLRLASQGLPKGGTVGFELVDNQKFGATQFQEQINYQRGLEGELARSIGALGGRGGRPRPSRHPQAVGVRPRQQTADRVGAAHAAPGPHAGPRPGRRHRASRREQRSRARPGSRERHRPERGTALAEARRRRGRARSQRALVRPPGRAGHDHPHRRHPRADPRARQRPRPGHRRHRLHPHRAGGRDVQAQRRRRRTRRVASSSSPSRRAAAPRGPKAFPARCRTSPRPRRTAPIDPKKPGRRRPSRPAADR